MIGNIVKNHKIIAALPLNGGEEGHMIVVGKSLPQEGKRHQPTFVTWWTDGQGTFDSPVWFTDHAASADNLRYRAIGSMIDRARYVMAGLACNAIEASAEELARQESR